MGEIDCEHLKQIRDDAYTQLVLVQIEAKDQSARKGFLGIFSKPQKSDDPEKLIQTPADKKSRSDWRRQKRNTRKPKKITKRIVRNSIVSGLIRAYALINLESAKREQYLARRLLDQDR